MLTHQEALLFLTHKPALSISVIEKEAGLPASTLPKAIAGQRTLNQKHLTALELSWKTMDY